VQADAATDEVYARLALVAEGEVKICQKINRLGCQMCQTWLLRLISEWDRHF
jgi:hypothetical protein